MAKLNTAIRGAQIDTAVAANGLQWNASENLEIDLDGSTLAVGASGVKLAALTDAYILVGNVSNVATGVAVSGDITLGNDGAVAIASGVIINADVKSDAAIAYSKLATMADGSILVGSAGTVATVVAMSGDVTIINDGTTSIGSGVIVNDDVKSDAAIAYSKLAALTSAYLLVGSAGNVATAVAVTGDVTITNGGVTAIGATKVLDSMINDDVATGLAGTGLAATTGVLAVDLNELATEATFAAAADYIAIVDATDNGSDKTLWSVIATAIAGTGITATNGVLSADTVTDNIIEGDIQKEMEAGDNSTTVFNLTSEPITNSVMVFLRGVLQEEGSGKCYILDAGAKTVTFATAPLTGDVISIHYIINN